MEKLNIQHWIPNLDECYYIQIYKSSNSETFNLDFCIDGHFHYKYVSKDYVSIFSNFNKPNFITIHYKTDSEFITRIFNYDNFFDISDDEMELIYKKDSDIKIHNIWIGDCKYEMSNAIRQHKLNQIEELTK